MAINGETETRVISRIFENREFGFLKVTVERPLRMNFEATPERIARLDNQTAFTNLATSKKQKDAAAAQHEIAEGQKQQEAIRAVLATFEDNGRYWDRAVFEADVMQAANQTGHKISAPIKKAIFAALGERDPDAEICRDSKGRPEPDSELQDTENIPLPPETTMPLPIEFGPKKPNDRLVEAFWGDIEAYIAREVLPHVPDAWVDYTKTKVGYEIPINRHFYVYKPPRPLDLIEVGHQRARRGDRRAAEGTGGMKAHDWEAWKLSHAYSRIGSGTTPTSSEPRYYTDSDGTPWVTTAELRENYISATQQQVTEEALEGFPTLRMYRSGSVMKAMYGATIGRLGMTEVAATCNQACCVFEVSKHFDNRLPILLALASPVVI